MSDEKLSVVLGTGAVTVKLPGGKSIELRPLNFNDLAKAEDFFGQGLDDWGTALKRIKNVTFLIWLAVAKSAPDMTLEKVGELFTLDSDKEVQEILGVIMHNSGLQQKNA